MRQRKRVRSPRWRIDGDEGIDFVRCHICGDHRRVISGRHLSKHDIDRETYMEEYDLSPDELIAKDFRMIQSSRRGFYPNGKSDWIDTLKSFINRAKACLPGISKINTHISTTKAYGFLAIGTRLCVAAGFDPKRMRLRTFWDQDRIIREIRGMRDKNLPLYAHYIMKNHRRPFLWRATPFPVLDNALLAAGINKKQASTNVYKSRPGILQNCATLWRRIQRMIFLKR